MNEDFFRRMDLNLLMERGKQGLSPAARQLMEETQAAHTRWRAVGGRLRELGESAPVPAGLLLEALAAMDDYHFLRGRLFALWWRALQDGDEDGAEEEDP